MSACLRHFLNVAHRLYRDSSSIKRTAFSSAVSLDKLYPGKSLVLSTPAKVSTDKNSNFSGHIPIERLQITYSRSGGAGGQNVNMLNSKVDVRFHVESADWLSNEVKSKLLETNKTRINKEGFLILKSEKTRSQQLNVADVMLKLRTLIRTAAEPPGEPSEESLEVARKRKMKAARLRLQEKRNHSMNKAQRRAPVIDY